MAEWHTYTLSELVSIKHGFAFPGEHFDDRPQYPMLVTPGNFAISGGFKDAPPKTFAGDFDPSWVLPAGALVVSMTDLSKDGATLGLPALIPAGATFLHNQRIGLVQPIRPRLVSTVFLSYLLRTSAYRSHVLATATGSTVRHTSPSRIGQFVTRIPPLVEQRAIAEVLGALDDKIAANTRLATAADELAKALFRVAVRGVEPGAKTFADVAEIGGGGTPSSKVPEYWDGEFAWASPTDITRLSGQPYLFETARSITPSGLANCASRMYPKGSLLMTSRATIGAFALAMTPTAVNQGFIVVVPPDDTLRYWLFHEMRDRVDEFLTHANGATFLELSRGNFRRLPVRLAEPSVMEEFGDRAGTLHTSAAATVRENRSLVATRDALLPALMSGALRVRDAERLVEDLT